jgi:hypothetical protein
MDVENENFKLLDEKSVILKKLKIKKRLQNKAQRCEDFYESKLSSDQLVFITTYNKIDNDPIQYLEKDKSLMDGKILPKRLGKVPINLLQQPLDELDPYISLKEEVSVNNYLLMQFFPNLFNFSKDVCYYYESYE